jgi:hypothetical protein
VYVLVVYLVVESEVEEEETSSLADGSPLPQTLPVGTGAEGRSLYPPPPTLRRSRRL